LPLLFQEKALILHPLKNLKSEILNYGQKDYHYGGTCLPRGKGNTGRMQESAHAGGNYRGRHQLLQGWSL
jgi:hypothetical protein